MIIKELTDKIRSTADKLKNQDELTAGERNIAKNLLYEYADSLELRSVKSSAVEKSDDPVKIKLREKVLRYRTKKRLKDLMEEQD